MNNHNEITYMAFTSAGLPNSREPHDRMVSLPTVSLVNREVMANQNLNLTSKESGVAVLLAETDKHDNYLELKEQYIFTVIPFESF